ncbi:MAG: glycosyltransferase [Chlorobiaceae bacterium]
MHRPLVTVLMPVFNGKKYLNTAIESILNQTYGHFELLILDDGSTDGSMNIVSSYKDSRIRLISSPENVGIEKTLNRGIELAQGKYIARMDCDDISLPHRLECQVSYMEQNPEIGVLGAAMQLLDNRRKTEVRRWPSTNDEIKIHLLFHNPLSHPVVMMRKESMAGLRYPEDCKYAEDYRFWTILADHTKFANLPLTLLQYRVHEGQITEKQASLSSAAARAARAHYVKARIADTSDDELLVHHQLSERDRYIDLESAKRWVEKIAESNREKGFFPQEQLVRVLAMIWWRCCRNNRTTGLGTRGIYKSSFLSQIPLDRPHYTMIYMLQWTLNYSPFRQKR